MEPLTVYARATHPWATDLGDGIFEGLVPTGWWPVVHAQPANGTVEIVSATGWRFHAPPLPGVESGNIPDSWQWRATNGTEYGEPHTVSVEITSAI